MVDRLLHDGLGSPIVRTMTASTSLTTSPAPRSAKVPAAESGRDAAGGTRPVDLEIRYAVGVSSLGSVLVAATDLGVCAIQLGDTPTELVRALQIRFPRAQLTATDAGLESTVAAVVGLVEDPGGDLSLPLDVRGTSFQRKVWKALREIPPGTTATYAQVAYRIGSPSAVRAVAGACAANRLAVLIPCHRVVRTDGALSGYAWGAERKRALLEREGALSGHREEP